VPLVKHARMTRKKILANRRNGSKSHGPKPRVEKPLNNGRAPGAPAEPAAGATGKADFSTILRAVEGVLDDPVCPEAIRSALVGMQENPVHFTHHHQELIDEWQPSTPTQRKLVLRLAYLMWRQQRVERAQDGAAVCRVEKELAARAQRMLEAAGAPAQSFVGEVPDEGGVRQLPPSDAKFEQLLEWLQFLIGHLAAGDFSPEWETVLKQIYGSKATRRSHAITQWARQLAQYLGPRAEARTEARPAEVPAQANGGGEGGREMPKGWEPPLDPIRSEARKDQVLHHLRRELAEEHRDVTMEYRLYKSLYLDFPWHLRDSLCAPQDKYSSTAIRQEQTLGQDIERTLRLIVTLKARDGSPDPPSGRAASLSRARDAGGPRRRASGGRK
jgi:hypothetical protein